MKADTHPPSAPASVRSFLAELLAEQSRLDTPVARFSHAHDAASSVSQLSALAPQLIPLTAPSPGEQYAFEVDLDSCTGCKSCVAACHSLNGLDENETWRDVGLLVSPSRARPFTQTVTTACHHCADPACLNGCPVLAYEKDPITGVVVHLDDQCIGCSYCVLKCPYDVPKFSSRLGIVRKCDMCHSRLAEGEAPACAQACPTHAIKIVTVPVAASTSFLRAAPDVAYTQPTTRYVTQRTLPENLVAADAARPRVQLAHWPLVFMLTLLPSAIGFSLASLPLAAWLTGALGLAASVFHLGQPLRAWRIFLGWRRSWLSREAMLFGAWFPLATLAAFAPRVPRLSALNTELLPLAATAVGLLGLFCSAMIYIDTRRRFWRASQTFPRFLGTAVLVAATLTAPILAAILLCAKIGLESRTCFDRSVSARLQRGPLKRIMGLRDLLGVVTIVLLVAAPGAHNLIPLLAGELIERLLFFRAVDAPKMPGIPTA